MLSQQNDFSNSEEKIKSINLKQTKTKENQQQQYLQDGEQILKKTKKEESCDNDNNLDQEDKFILRYTGEENIEDLQTDEQVQQNKKDKNTKKIKKNKQDDKNQNLDEQNVKVEQNEVEQQDEEVKENIFQADKINGDSKNKQIK
ncbi:hypothetical protein PPERSA_09506 [Pseudocohnilembus persalinus]|uniref:Uncharacterized protein n=1 Tax=Pseudocohnilembus persalinus TaxID=266149 RepID=A0A0V0QFE0_PSEPJ|nr:hypothetical protein PPERSA_09506 [Pseudocohnilembus persalinus]|eukprot:KRX00900.1 hypothetical protein PPERSA_09506 [Pseudocohnilembus persalinus]